ncbi:MFS transporter [Neisseria perflava]|uniref:MFS transporter n=1 Tax=Neisseria perflava TaxID=33053 RepID=UPI002646524D|nr:MFS transporter [Neisseria perflava]MCP1660191.1 OHS family lactose permease-like MFS transporter [Neisseria perflava]MCP1771927.1 OHS family lactose permease-like MFS transporter [Neisseria perflava]
MAAIQEAQENAKNSCYYLKNWNFWIFGAYFFLYFFIMATCYPFLPIWLSDVNGLSKTDTGIVFSFMSFFALCAQPIFGYITDKLGLKKHLLWILAVGLVLFAPFFIYVFGPLLQTNVVAGAIAGGLYMGFVFSGGAPASEAFVEKVSRHSQFEFGRARMFGMIGWGICASIVGILFGIDPNLVFWMGSGAAVILFILLFFAKTDGLEEKEAKEERKSKVSLAQAIALLKLPRFWALLAYVIGVSCTYDIFDQQFANFFTSFFSSKAKGTEVFGYVTTMGELLNACIMFVAPVIINRIGAKKALLIAGTIMSVRILGSAFAQEAWQVVVLKTLHMFEVPFLLVGIFKYITTVFDENYSATIYLVAYGFGKQVTMMFMSTYVGTMYDKMGFHSSYLLLGTIAAVFTVISAIVLTPPEKALVQLNKQA